MISDIRSQSRSWWSPCKSHSHLFSGTEVEDTERRPSGVVAMSLILLAGNSKEYLFESFVDAWWTIPWRTPELGWTPSFSHPPDTWTNFSSKWPKNTKCISSDARTKQYNRRNWTVAFGCYTPMVAFLFNKLRMWRWGIRCCCGSW